MFLPSEGLLSALSDTPPSKNPSQNPVPADSLTRCLLRTLLRSASCKEPSKNPSEKRVLSGPLNRLNSILSLLHPLDDYRTPSSIGSAIGRPYLALSRIHTGGSPQPPCSKPVRGLNRTIVAQKGLKTL